MRASDGESVYRPPGRGRYATADQLDIEKYLLDAAIAGGAAGWSAAIRPRRCWRAPTWTGRSGQWPRAC